MARVRRTLAPGKPQDGEANQAQTRITQNRINQGHKANRSTAYDHETADQIPSGTRPAAHTHSRATQSSRIAAQTVGTRGVTLA